MSAPRVRCLILACGNTLRGDDGVGPWLADRAIERFARESTVRVVSPQQWTPDLAEDVAHADAVVFVDCAVGAAPGSLRLARVQPAHSGSGVATHHVDPTELLALSQELYASLPRNALLLTIGAGSTEMSESFSQAVKDALPKAWETLQATVSRLLAMTGS